MHVLHGDKLDKLGGGISAEVEILRVHMAAILF
jgi:hypothetical protein